MPLQVQVQIILSFPYNPLTKITIKCQRSVTNTMQNFIKAKLSNSFSTREPAVAKNPKSVTSNETKHKFSDYSMTKIVVCNSRLIE